MVYRANINLTKLSNTQLKAIVVAAVAHGIQFSDIEKNSKEYYFRARTDVKYAVAAIDLYISKFTTRHVIEPSPESRMWSDWEGGHVSHEKPSDSDIVAKLFK